MILRNFLLVFVSLLAISLCAVQEDLLKSVPGYGADFNTSVYSGYLNTANNSRQLHYVFVESVKGKNNSDPVTLWLNGGPGCSSMIGFLQEIGPYFLEDGKDYKEGDNLTFNNHSWHNVSNLLFIESPAGVGFSYNLDTKYQYNDSTTAADALSAVLYFFSKYPEYLANPFWIAGESYAGKYIPDLAVLIDKNNLDSHINLRGILVGNGVMNFQNGELEVSSIEYMIDHEFIDPELINYWKTSCLLDPLSAGCTYFISRYEEDLDDINPYNVYDYCFYNGTKVEQKEARRSQVGILREIAKLHRANSDFFKLQSSGSSGKYGSAPCIYLDGIHSYFTTNRQAFHAKFPSMEFNGPCANNITYHVDLKGSMASYRYLLAKWPKYAIFLYNGDWDDVVPYGDTIKNLEKLNLSPQHSYTAWHTNGQHSGFMQTWSGVHFVIFKGASHMVPQSKRPEALQFFSGVVRNNKILLTK